MSAKKKSCVCAFYPWWWTILWPFFSLTFKVDGRRSTNPFAMIEAIAACTGAKSKRIFGVNRTSVVVPLQLWRMCNSEELQLWRMWETFPVKLFFSIGLTTFLVWFTSITLISQASVNMADFIKAKWTLKLMLFLLPLDRITYHTAYTSLGKVRMPRHILAMTNQWCVINVRCMAIHWRDARTMQ